VIGDEGSAWEILSGTIINVDITFDDTRSTSVCILQRLGIIAQAVKPPSKGIAFGYATGGADVPRRGMEVAVTSTSGRFYASPVADIPSLNTTGTTITLSASDPILIELNVIGDALGSHNSQPGSGSMRAAYLRVFVEVLLRGRRYTITSRKGFRAVLSIEGAPWRQVDDDITAIEEIRARAYD
jgi:hypothetical protein